MMWSSAAAFSRPLDGRPAVPDDGARVQLPGWLCPAEVGMQTLCLQIVNGAVSLPAPLYIAGEYAKRGANILAVRK